MAEHGPAVAGQAINCGDSIAADDVLSDSTPSLRVLLTGATGFLGGFSTFSTAINEMVTLFRKHRYPTAAAYLVLSLGVPVVAAACGFLV